MRPDPLLPRRAFLLLTVTALALSSCAGLAPRRETVPLVIWFDNYNEVMSGTATPYDFLQATSLDVRSEVGAVRCVGRSRTRIVPPDAQPPARCDGMRGDAELTCSDGRQIALEWMAGDGCNDGYGKGKDAQGHGFHLAFGGSPARAQTIARDALNELAGRPALPPMGSPQQASAPTVSTGTAFFVSWEGFLLTNHHVVGHGTTVRVKLDDGDLVDARVVASDPKNDLALLRVDAIRQPLVIRAQSGLSRGQEVLTLGFPLIALQGQEQKATFGRVNALSGFQDDERFAQIDVPIQPGNSGGPLLNRRGEVVGIVTSMLHPMATLEVAGVVPQNVNYALKSDLARALVDRTREREGEVMTLQAAEQAPVERDLTDLVKRLESSVVLVVAQ